MANGSFLEGNERNMEEIGGRTLAGESQVECHFVGSQRRNYSRDIGDAWYPKKMKVDS